jgi:hypothetical protein
LAQGVVDLGGNFGRVYELCDVAGDFGAHVGKDVEIPVAKGMVQKHAIALGERRRAANNVDNGNVLGVGAGNAVHGGQLTHAKGGNEGAYTVDSGVAISGVSYKEKKTCH